MGVEHVPQVEPKYKCLTHNKIIRANGTIMVPVNSFLFPKTEEEKNLCKYFESIGHLSKVK